MREKEKPSLMFPFQAMRACVAHKTEITGRALGVSATSVARWCRAHGGETDTGARSPLETLCIVMETAIASDTPAEDALAPLYYLAERFEHIVLEAVEPGESIARLEERMLEMLGSFGELAVRHKEAMQDNRLTKEEMDELLCCSLAVARAVRAYMQKIKGGGVHG